MTFKRKLLRLTSAFRTVSAAATCLLILYSAFAGCGSSRQSESPGQDSAGGEKNRRAAMERYLSGLEAESKEDYANAILEFQEAAEIYPTAAIYFSLGKNFAILNKLPAALQNARQAYLLDSTNAEYGLLLQDIYTTARLNDSAMLVLEKIIRQDSSQIEAYYKLAQLCENTKPKRAIELYKKILTSLGFEWSVLQRLAQLYDRLGDIKGCVRSLEELSSADPDNINLQLLLIEYYQRDDNDEKAAAKLDELLQFYPDNLEVIEGKAKLMIRKKDWEKAAEYYLKAFSGPEVQLEDKIRISTLFLYTAIKDSSALPYARTMFQSIDKDTVDWQVKMYLGAIELETGNDSLALLHLHKATELAPYNAEAWIRLGGLYFDERKYKEAVAVLKEAVDKFPEEFSVHLILGLSFAQMDKYPEAGPHLEKAVSLNPKDLNALSSWGYTLYKLARFDEAVSRLNQALELDPANVNIMSTLGLIYDDREMWGECDSIYLAALAVDSANALIKNNYAYSLSKRGIRLDDALRMVTEALEKEPANSSYLDTKGWVYFKMNKYREAKEFIKKSLDLNGDNAVVLEHLGDALTALGQMDEARSAYTRALELDPDNSLLKEKIK